MDIPALRTFVAVIEEGSFAAAARRLGISRSMCSKHVADLEADLGTRLLNRTTRSVRPTALGLEYGDNIREVLDRLDIANDSVRTAAGNPAGVLKIGAPISYTLKILQPHLLRFMEEYPGIRLEMVLDDGTAEVVGDGFDAVVRIGDLADSTMYAIHLHDAMIVMVASPDYIARRGQPQKPADLLHHDCLHYTNLRGAETWPLRQNGEIIYQKIQPVFSSNNSDMLHSMAINGRGITLMPELAITEDLTSGRLARLMPEYSVNNLPVHLVYPSGKLMTGAMRHFLDFCARLRLT
ncbi:LysR substrate-binding domain-containing protein [Paracoccus sp. (in: a-proteobacteria)]|uniref:LysR family transcriptional regulator n=1 Tax=Paracoccus sp. TaxID=267 RepID=UPI003A88623D